ncbi:MAG: hypothetical protein ABI651_20280 [Verrucomicrobiota bacterium]
MKLTDNLLKRLFKAAASVPQPEPCAPRFALEARILAAWRTSRSAGESSGMLRFFRIGLGLAAVLMVVIIGLSAGESTLS